MLGNQSPPPPECLSAGFGLCLTSSRPGGGFSFRRRAGFRCREWVWSLVLCVGRGGGVYIQQAELRGQMAGCGVEYVTQIGKNGELLLFIFSSTTWYHVECLLGKGCELGGVELSTSSSQ